MIEVTAGLLVRRQIRKELDKFVKAGNITEYQEYKGFLESDFVIYGETPSFRHAVMRMIDKFNREA